ncbi:MAG: molybdopterin molybdotransferase MoeA [Flavobacteriales bacterium]|nr:molybdopterin molybdotransferase MoeA [Flavobacteriales bacterium]
MRTVEQALDHIRESVSTVGIQRMAVTDVLGLVLAEEVISAIDMPPFPQSAMDGYALGKGERIAGSRFKVVGEIAAGSPQQFDLGEGEAVRIFTGAPVPHSTVAVVQQEWIQRHGDYVILDREVPDAMHIRPQGEQFRKGELVADAGTLATPATIGLLCMMGCMEVTVYRRPSVAVLVTGNELVAPGRPLGPGQVYESNSAMLLAALVKAGIVARVIFVADDRQLTVDAVNSALQGHDLVLISGGISVGDHDHVYHALMANGVSEVFYKVMQRPGKPLLFGRKGSKYVFALPGNPAAALTCFYVYVWEALLLMAGRNDAAPRSMRLPIGEGTVKAMDRAQFLKARVVNGQVTVLGAQSSAMLHSFATANALVYVPMDREELRPGDEVEVMFLPDGNF